MYDRQRRERVKGRRGEYPLNQSLFIVQGGLKSTCSGTRARPYGFITAVQIISAQIPDMDRSSSAPAFLRFPPSTFSPPVSVLGLYSNILKVNVSLFRQIPAFNSFFFSAPVCYFFFFFTSG